MSSDFEIRTTSPGSKKLTLTLTGHNTESQAGAIYRAVIQAGGDITNSGSSLLAKNSLTLDSQNSISNLDIGLKETLLGNTASITAQDGLSLEAGKNITVTGANLASGGDMLLNAWGDIAVTTGNHTQLDGAVIASTASADKNSLDTGTLGFSNLHNESQTSGNGYTVALSGSAGGSGNGENRNLAPAIGTGQAEESHTGTTSSAVSGGSIVIRNPAGQKQDIADLSRDTADAHHGVDVSGDVQKVRDNLAVQSEGAALATSALDAYGKYAEQKARESNAALGAKLASEGKLQGDTPQEQEAFLKTQPGYQNTEYGPGSAFWTKGSAAAGLLAGALGGNLKAGAAAGAAPLLATLVKEQKDPTARAALHGIVAAALTQLSGGSSADGLKAGAIGAITASAMTDHLVSALYGDKKSSDLTPEEKRLVSSLVSIAGGLAGAAVTDGSVSMAAMASETAKVEVENNSLGVAPPVPVPVPGVPVSPGDQVTKNANDKIASAVDDLFDAVDKATQCSFGRACSSDDSNQESKPNVAGNMTDNEKAEYGGAGSGTPGGWEPQDEENARNNEAHSSTNGKNLNSELVGKEIAGGHAFEKHVLQQGEFTGLGIRTRAQFAQHIENVVKNPTSTKELSNGRSAYWDQSTGTVVIRNPKASDGGTAFRPVNGRTYFDNLR
ncbi:hypothetical protein EAAEB30_18455 [Enterobacter asburiae]|nr:hypothetical protein EAAEB30_18455 [Enterobacter asburiae]